MGIETDLRHVIYALADALDMVGVDDIGHGKRVGIMVAECMRARGGSESEIAFMFDLGMLHDIGVSSTRVHCSLTREFDWAGSQEHCVTGAERLRAFAPLAAMAEPVLYHHTRWDELLAAGVAPRVAWQANLIYLADRVDVLASAYYADGTVFAHLDEIRAQLAERRGSYFSPELIDLFLAASANEAFWLMLDARSVERYMQDMLEYRPLSVTDMQALRKLAQIFAGIVDAKSFFTARHSTGVASLARFVAEQMGVGADHCEKLEIAGLLHDLGKLRVPDEILEKPGKLDSHERNIINTHSFETYQILRHIRGFEEITAWAAAHHEEPGGGGYPFHLKGETLPLEARILRVADIFQAMVQHRPYRQGLNQQEVRQFMNELVALGKVDAEVVGVVLAHLDEAMQRANI